MLFRSKNAVEDAADATGDMMENAQGMMMAAGSRIQDVIMELEENLGITMPEKLDQQSLPSRRRRRGRFPDRCLGCGRRYAQSR